MGLIARPISAIYDTRHRSYLDHSLAEDNDRASGPMLSRLENSVSRKDIYRLAPVRGALAFQCKPEEREILAVQCRVLAPLRG